MTKSEFYAKYLNFGANESRDARMADLVALIDSERKAAKQDAFGIALRLHASNPNSFAEVLGSLISGQPPVYCAQEKLTGE